MSVQEAPDLNRDIQSHLSSLLEREIQQLEDLRDVLETEKYLLGQHDIEATEQTSKRKRAAVSILEKYSRERFDFIRSRGIDPLSENWFDEFTANQNIEIHLQESYDGLMQLTSQCRAMNQTNGLLINRRERLTSSVVNLLRANSTPATYSESGQSQNSSQARSLGRA